MLPKGKSGGRGGPGKNSLVLSEEARGGGHLCGSAGHRLEKSYTPCGLFSAPETLPGAFIMFKEGYNDIFQLISFITESTYNKI